MAVLSRRLMLVALLSAVLVSVLWMPRATATNASLPDRLTDREFWQLTNDLSEPGGYFRNENITNLTSNELMFQFVIPDLVTRAPPGGVYLGVGPEQNYTYMAAIRPKMAIIFDIRRGNLDTAADVQGDRSSCRPTVPTSSRCCSRSRDRRASRPVRRPTSCSRRMTAWCRPRPLYRVNLAAVRRSSRRPTACPCRREDLAGITEIYRTFHQSGFAVRSSPTYAELMTADRRDGDEPEFSGE